MQKKLFLVALIIIILAALGYIYDQGLLPTERLTESSGKLREIKSRGTLLIGTHATYPPMESRDDAGNFIGMDIEIAKEVATDLGVSPEFKDIAWEKIFGSVKSGEVDMIISSITITKERGETMGFSDPYFNAGQVIVGLKKDQGAITKPEDLRGKKVGAQTETTSEKEASVYSEDVRPLKNNYDGKKLLLAGDIRAIVMDYPTAVEIVGSNDKLAILSEVFTQEFYGIATQKGQDDLLAAINKTVRNMKRNGTLKKLENVWLVK